MVATHYNMPVRPSVALSQGLALAGCVADACEELRGNIEVRRALLTKNSQIGVQGGILAMGISVPRHAP